MRMLVGLALAAVTTAASIHGDPTADFVSSLAPTSQASDGPRPCTNSTMDMRLLDKNRDGLIDEAEFTAWALAVTPEWAALVPLDHDEPPAAVARRSLQSSNSPFNNEAELHACEDALYHMHSTQPGSHITIHVYMMSKCPFAARALKALIPAMIQMQLFDYVTLQLDFIGHGSVGDLSGLQSLHGRDEVMGDKLYLCMQSMAFPIQQWMLLAICIASDPASVPYNANACFEMAHVNQKQVEAITDCVQVPGGEGDKMLSESFHMTTKEHRIANSPTIFFDVKQEVNNRTNIEDRIEVLYCGDRGPADFVSALCSLLGSLLRSDDLRGDMVPGGVDECPTSMASEPECTDNSVKMGPAWFLVPVLFLGCSVAMFICHGVCLRMRGNRGRPINPRRVGILDAESRPPQTRRSPGMNATEIARLPQIIMGQPDCEEDKPICSICFDTLEAGDPSYQLSCRHHHHQACLRDWLKRKAECPECRGAVDRNPGAPPASPAGPPPPELVAAHARHLAAAAAAAAVAAASNGGELVVLAAAARDDTIPPPPPPPPPPPNCPTGPGKVCTGCRVVSPGDAMFCIGCGAACPTGSPVFEVEIEIEPPVLGEVPATVVPANATAMTISTDDGLEEGLVLSSSSSNPLAGGALTDYI